MPNFVVLQSLIHVARWHSDGKCLGKTYLLQRFSLVHVLHVGCRHVQAVVRAIVLEVVVVREHVLNMPRPRVPGRDIKRPRYIRIVLHLSTHHNLHL